MEKQSGKFVIWLCICAMLVAIMPIAVMSDDSTTDNTTTILETQTFSDYTTIGAPNGWSIPSNKRAATDGSFDRVVPVSEKFGKESGDVAVAIEKLFYGTLSKDSAGNDYVYEGGGSTETFDSDDYIQYRPNTQLITDSNGDGLYTEELYNYEVLHFSLQFAYEGAENLRRYANVRFYRQNGTGTANVSKNLIELAADGTVSLFGIQTAVSLQPERWYTVDTMVYLCNEDMTPLTNSSGTYRVGVKSYINGSQIKLGDTDEDGIFYVNIGATPIHKLQHLRYGSNSGDYPFPYELTAFDNVAITACTRDAVPEMSPIPDLSLHSLFSDGAVLPRDKAFQIYGKAMSGAKITATINSKTYNTTAGIDGLWSVDAEALSVENNPYSLQVSASTGESLTVSNLLAGDIWLCSGQSNMDHSLNTLASEEKYDYTAELAEIENNDNLRFFTHSKRGTTEREWDVSGGSWSACNPSTAANFSAVGYYFGKKLQKDTNVPVGLIESAYSGTMIEYWISTDSLIENGYSSRAEVQDSSNSSKGSGKLFNAMIAPLTDYKITGAIWYQGEGNYLRYYEYLDLSKILLNEWRAEWGYDFPFIITQVAPYTEREETFPKIREAQRAFVGETDNTDMAVILDVGDKARIHPKDKKSVGSRLALAAEHTAYNMDVQSKYPSPKEILYSYDSATIKFENAYDGLSTPEGSSYLDGFEVRNADGEFHPATAEITGNDTVVVSADTVKDIRGVRYGFTDCTKVNLFNSAGLIATPFTDNWQDSLETFSAYNATNAVPPASTYFSASAKNDLIATSNDSYRKVYSANGIYGKDEENTSLVLESNRLETMTSQPYLMLSWSRNNSFTKADVLHIGMQMAFEGGKSYSRGLTMTIYGTQKANSSRSYDNKTFISAVNGRLVSNGIETDVLLEEKKWYTFDMLLYSGNADGDSVMGYELYCNGRKVHIDGESEDSIKYFTSSHISDMTYVSQFRLIYNDAAGAGLMKTAYDNIFMEYVNIDEFSPQPMEVDFSNDNNVITANISLEKQTDLTNADVIVAKYNEDNELITIYHSNTRKLESGAARFSVENMELDNNEHIKVFAWTTISEVPRPLDMAEIYSNE